MRPVRIVGGPTGALVRVYGTDGRQIEGLSKVEILVNGNGLIEARLTFCRVELELEAESRTLLEDELLVSITDPLTREKRMVVGTFRSRREEEGDRG
jgi:hypothetical protein